jgi:hypothetical protein
VSEDKKIVRQECLETKVYGKKSDWRKECLETRVSGDKSVWRQDPYLGAGKASEEM